MEPVRLVIWDLDGVFWSGNFSEGGFIYRPDCHEIVVELARRGIMSSICSKNDLAAVRPVLEAHGIWEYFIFPSIGWQPKGQRIAALVEAVQLRPASVMFVDDEPLNLAEARYYLPDIQTGSDAFIPDLLRDPRFAGKDDRGLTRLAQYKVLETRQADVASHGHDNLAFLRASCIRVTIDYDVEANLDRAIELINRTNQLNFTKRRLPEDLVAARAHLLKLIQHHESFFGLVKVQDRYGDYGYVGFFAIAGSGRQLFLRHFCFSCRILNTGVEAWVYRYIGRPPVLFADGIDPDFLRDTSDIDWITLSEETGGAALPETRIIDRLVVRGGCDLSAISHYLAPLAKEFCVEAHTARDNRQLRTESSVFYTQILGEISDAEATALRDVGYLAEDWTSALALPRAPNSKTVWILSFWFDGFIHFYRHRMLDVIVPFFLERDAHFWADLTTYDEARAAPFLLIERNRAAYETLKRDFEHIGMLTEPLLHRLLGKVIAAAGNNAMVFVLMPPEKRTDSETGVWVPRENEARLNGWLRSFAAAEPALHLVDIMDFVAPGALIPEYFHFDRQVYQRTAAHIAGAITEQFGGA